MMVFVGLLGGASYVNVIYLVRSSALLDKTEKELAMTILTIFNDIGILLASVTALILNLTVY